MFLPVLSAAGKFFFFPPPQLSVYIPRPISSFSFGQTSYTLEPTAIQHSSRLSQLLLSHFNQQHYRTASGPPMVFYIYTIKNFFSGFLIRGYPPCQVTNQQHRVLLLVSPYMGFLVALKFSLPPNLRSVFFDRHQHFRASSTTNSSGSLNGFFYSIYISSTAAQLLVYEMLLGYTIKK